jgi:hypothetical protein
MHNLKLIRRRFPGSYPRIVATLLALSVAALAIGVGLLLLAG